MMTLALALSLVSGGGGKIDWQRGAREAPLESAIRKARESGGVVLAYFTADW
jgi:hypothetical protein